MDYLEMARQAHKREEYMYNSPSGTDTAEAPLFMFEANMWRKLYVGEDVETSLGVMLTEWKIYAKGVRAKVAKTKKTSFGPKAGQSCIEYKWVSDEYGEDRVRHIRTLLNT